MKPPVPSKAAPRRAQRSVWLGLAVILCLECFGCATVPKNRRRYLAHPGMPGQDDELRKRAVRKFHTTREAAAGGDGKPAGGGCGCGN